MPTDEAEPRRFPRIEKPSFDTPESEQATERRAHPRYQYQVAVGILGLRPRSGVTADISRGGVKVGLADPVSDSAKGQQCGLRFLDAGEELRPHYVVGTVRRVEATEEGCFVGIEFDAPLEALELSDRPSLS